MGFYASIKSCFSNYATFSGRAKRSEFWWFFLFCTLILSATIALAPLAVVVMLAIALPLISVGIRRLHDIDRSGWWICSYVIPIIGNIILFLIWNCRRGTEGPNRFDNNSLCDTSPVPASTSVAPSTSMTERAEQLAKLKALLDGGTITREEFDRLKADVLTS